MSSVPSPIQSSTRLTRVLITISPSRFSCVRSSPLRRCSASTITVGPHRLGEALLRLADAGLDLELPSVVTPASAFTTLLMRVNLVLAGGFDLLPHVLPLRAIDLIPTVSSPTPDNLPTQWPSLVMFGDLVQPADSSLASAADLVGLLGFRLHYSNREDSTSQFFVIANALVAPQLAGPMESLGDDSKPALLAVPRARADRLRSRLLSSFLSCSFPWFLRSFDRLLMFCATA